MTAAFVSLLLWAVPLSAFAQVVTTEDDRLRDMERTRAVRARDIEADRTDGHHSSELYVAGFGEYTVGHGINDVEGTVLASGVRLGDINLNSSRAYGGKLGYFLADRLNWLGLEIEAFHTSPHIEQSTLLPSATLRVTTVVSNALARAKLLCSFDDDRRSDTRRIGASDARHDFCRWQLYVGAGLGLFFCARVLGGGQCLRQRRSWAQRPGGRSLFCHAHVSIE
jgi:hypothetical protein